MYRLFINEEEVELNKNGKIQLSKTLFDISDMTKRGINFTNSINLPFTEKNDRLTGYPSRLANNNQAFESNQSYRLIGDNSIVSVGDVIIKSYSEKKGIKIQLAEGFNFWAVAGKKLLNDLFIPDQDVEWTSSNMTTLKTRTDDVFLNALFSSNGTPLGSQFHQSATARPCYVFKNVLDKIIAELGYTLNYNDTLDTALNNVGCLSNAEKHLLSDIKITYSDVDFSGNMDFDFGGGFIGFVKAGNPSVSGDEITNVLYETSYVIKGTVFAEVATTINLNHDGVSERIIIPKGTSFVNFRSDDLPIGTVITISTPLTVTLVDAYIYTAINETNIFTVGGSLAVNNFLMLADYNLPQQTYKQFIKNLLSMFFIDMAINENSKTIELRSLKDSISTNNSIDLSGNIDRYYPTQAGKVFGQLNVMRYENESTISPDLGAAFFSLQNENAVDSKEFLKFSEYSASAEVVASTNTVVSVPIYDTDLFTREAVKNRIVYLENTGTWGWNAVFNLISMQRIHSDIYFDFIDATKRERVVEFTAFLTTLQFRELQRKPIAYVDFLRSYFLITEIKGFEENQKCKLKAIKYN